MHEREEYKVSYENMKGRNCIAELGLKEIWWVWTGFIWLRIGTGGGLL
jgi:hypothetical protein